jgi:hypothetical protein
LVVTGSLALSSAQRNINTADTQLVPASTALGTAIENYGAGSTALENLVQAPHAGALAAGADQLTTLNDAAVSAWKNYERYSANLPGEAKLRDKVNQETEQISQQGVALLSNPTPSAVAAFASLSDQKQQDLTAIQNLYQTRINAVVASTNRSFETRTHGLLPVLAAVLVLNIIAFGIVIASIRRRYLVQLAEDRRTSSSPVCSVPSSWCAPSPRAARSCSTRSNGTHPSSPVSSSSPIRVAPTSVRSSRRIPRADRAARSCRPTTARPRAAARPRPGRRARRSTRVPISATATPAIARRCASRSASRARRSACCTPPVPTRAAGPDHDRRPGAHSPEGG